MRNLRVIAAVGAISFSVLATSLATVATRGTHASPQPRASVRCFDVATTWFADGSVQQSWTDSQGHTATTRIWSPRLNLLTAPPAELARYGISRRPTDPAALRAWNFHWTHSRSALIAGVCEDGSFSRPSTSVR